MTARVRRRLRWVKPALRWSRDRVRFPRAPRLRFRCNLCGHRTSWSRAAIGRETSSCGFCGSTVRFRAVGHVLDEQVFGGAGGPHSWPGGSALRGIGFSDDAGYARHLARAASYTNAWFHQPPVRDVTDPASFAGETYDFVVCSEVLEHVTRPVGRAFRTLFSILRPGGVLVLSVPLVDGPTIEHFPELAEHSVLLEEGGWVLDGVTPAGERLHVTGLVFHGGPGSTLEMRILGREDVARHLADAGFTDVREHRVDVPGAGIVWDVPDTMRTPGGTVRGLRAGVWSARRPVARPGGRAGA